MVQYVPLGTNSQKLKYMEKQIEILKHFEEQEWTTKNNKRIKIRDLELSHLKNIVKLQKKRFKEMGNPENDFPSFLGEQAQICAMREWEHSIRKYRSMKRQVKLFEAYYKLKSLE